MTDTKRLLEVRKTIKSKKPAFIQQDYHKKRRLSLKWKRPTGIQSKMRHQFKGYRRRVKQGWRSPQAIRGYHRLGYETVLIRSIKDMDHVQKDHGIIIASNIGVKKKLAIIDKAMQMNVPVLNIKVDAYKKKIEDKKTKLVEEKKFKEDKKKKTLEDSLKKSDKLKQDKEKLAKAEKTEEEKKEEEKKEKEEEKKEKDEVLIHKAA